MPKAKLKSKTTSNRPAQRRLRVQSMVRVRPRGTAVTVEDDVTWFYEYRGKIEIIHWCKDENGKNRHASHIKIPWRLLMDSARRCRPEEVKHPNVKLRQDTAE